MGEIHPLELINSRLRQFLNRSTRMKFVAVLALVALFCVVVSVIQLNFVKMFLSFKRVNIIFCLLISIFYRSLNRLIIPKVQSQPKAKLGQLHVNR